MSDSVSGKSLRSSKTFWVNMATAVAGVLVYLQGSEVIADNPQIVAGIGIAIGVLNVFLRVVTGKPIKSV